MRQADHVLSRNSAGGAESDIIAVAVAGEKIGLNTEPRQQAEHAETGRAKGRLRDIRSRQHFLGLLLLFRCEGRRWEDELAQRPAKRPARAASAASKLCRTSGNTIANWASMLGYCDPWPGKRNAMRSPCWRFWLRE